MGKKNKIVLIGVTIFLFAIIFLTYKIYASKELPKVYITVEDEEAFRNLTKDETDEEEKTAELVYTDDSGTNFSSHIKIKIQGSSSANFPKKNYTIKLYEDSGYSKKYKVDMGQGWGNFNKYCLKANWIDDKTHSRNIVTARIAAKVQELYSLFTNTPNNGVIDGFPVEMYLNGEFLGLYTWNIPKDAYMWNLDEDNPNHIAMEGSLCTNSTYFREEIASVDALKDDANRSGWEVVAGSETQETVDKLNRVIRFVKDSTDEEFRENFENYINKDAMLNYLAVQYMAEATDNVARNMIFVTYDGKIWYPSLYDLDTTYGVHHKGETLHTNYYWLPEAGHEIESAPDANKSLLLERVIKCFADELAERWFELRKNALSKESILNEFNNFIGEIPEETFELEAETWKNSSWGGKTWKTIPGFDFDQINDFLNIRLPFVDSIMYDKYTITPSLSIEYSTTNPTNGTVIATAVANRNDITFGNKPTTYTFKSNGTYTFTAIDGAGNEITQTATVDWIDKTIPVATGIKLSEANTKTGKIKVTAEGVADAGGSGVSNVWWYLKNSAGERVLEKQESDGKWYKEIDISALPEGRYRVGMVIRDNAGNINDTTYSDSIGWVGFFYDKTAPIIESLEIKNITTEGYDVYVYGVSDEGCGINRVKFPTWTSANEQDDLIWGDGVDKGNGTWYYRVNIVDHNNEEGIYCTDVYAYDNLENRAQLVNITSTVIDKTAPTAGTLTMKLNDKNGNEYQNNTWTNKNVYIEVVNGTDTLSGHKSTTYSVNGGEQRTEAQVLTESGIYEIVVTTTDNAGNVATNSYTIKIRKPESISVITNPYKVTYNAYEDFNTEGMKVAIRYENGDTEETTEYTVINGENLTCKTKEIEIQYNQNAEIKTIVPITVGHAVVTDEKIEPTCIEKGKTEGKHCEVCKVVLVKQEEISPLGHKFTKYTSRNDATCTEDGTKISKCERCIKIDTIVDKGTKLGHNYESKVTDSTCTEKGYTTHTCRRCKDSYADTYTEVLGHNFTNYTSNNDGTCTEDGTQTAKCDRCEERDTKADEGSKLGHNYESKVTAPTCTEKGYTTHTCTRCSDSYVDTYTEVLAHNFTNYISNNDATCIEDGTQTAKCDRCEETKTIADEGSKLGHNYESKVTAPTCTEQGYTTHTCRRCKDSYVDTYTELLGHTFTNYTSNNDATCTEDGTKTAKCDRCEETDTKVDEGSKIAHIYEDGKCTACGEEELKLKITSEEYEIEDPYISNIKPKTTIKELKEKIETNGEIKIFKGTKEIVDENAKVETGMTIKVTLNEEEAEYTLVVIGDCNGTGTTTVSDLTSLMMSRAESMSSKKDESKILKGAFAKAVDMDGNGKIGISDITLLCMYIVANK